MFHIGGDEVNFRCWNETKDIVTFMAERGWERTVEGVLTLQSYYHNRTLVELDDAYGREQDVMIWASEMIAKNVGRHFTSIPNGSSFNSGRMSPTIQILNL